MTTAAQALEALRQIADEAMDQKNYPAFDFIRQHIESTAAELANERARGIHTCGPGCTRSGCVNAKLREELESLRKDAARYRGLRDNPDVDPGHLLFWQTEEDRALIDEKVDAALTQGGK